MHLLWMLLQRRLYVAYQTGVARTTLRGQTVLSSLWSVRSRRSASWRTPWSKRPPSLCNGTPRSWTAGAWEPQRVDRHQLVCPRRRPWRQRVASAMLSPMSCGRSPGCASFGSHLGGPCRLWTMTGQKTDHNTCLTLHAAAGHCRTGCKGKRVLAAQLHGTPAGPTALCTDWTETRLALSCGPVATAASLMRGCSSARGGSGRSTSASAGVECR
mmetsp:Transcript_110741/g.357459  ORF Transcript_110741/g.357459 Transcript_110741/m.357459 type:complete len:214 (-) Transcript_110741:581-1222(-)